MHLLCRFFNCCTISFTTSLKKPPSRFVPNFPSYFDSYEWKSFQSEVKSLKKCQVSVYPSTLHSQVDVDRFLFKWKINFSDGIGSFVPNVISFDTNRNDQTVVEDDLHQEIVLRAKKLEIALDCMRDAYERFIMLLIHIIDIPSLEKLSITDSGKRGRSYLSNGGNVAEVRRLLHSSSETNHKKLRGCYIRLLKLLVSGYTMKGVTLILFERDDLPEENDDFINIGFKDDDDFKDKEKAAYCEAVKEIFNKHRGLIEIL